MKLKIIITALIISFILLSHVMAEENKIDGYVDVTGKLVDINGSKAKFNEYRDLKSGVYEDIRLGYDTESYFMKMNVSDIGYRTQNYRIDGGMWGKFKLYLDYTEIPHNITFGAKSFYSGIGSNNLTGAPNTDVTTWSSFDYKINRKQYGGGIRADMLKPLFLNVSVSREDRKGIKPAGASITDPDGPSIELPEPVDYTTNTLKVETGYAKNPLFTSLSFLYSDFDNDNHLLSFQHPTAGGTDNLTLPPDNQYYKIGFKGAVQLPLHSKFNVNLSSSRAKSNFNLLSSYIFQGAPTDITLSKSVFNGKFDTRNYAFVLTSNPYHFLNGKIFYKYYDRKNKSDSITTTDPNLDSPFANSLFAYRKNSFGMELGFRLPANFSIIPAYNYVKTSRSRKDLIKTEDNIYSVDVKWSGIDFLTAKAGYEKLKRNAFHGLPTMIGDENDKNASDISESFLRRYDAGPQERDTYRASVDLFPIESLALDLGYQYKRAGYLDSAFGARYDRRDEFTIDAGYNIGKIARLNAYFDYERIRLYQFQRQSPDNATTGLSPFDSNTATNFNWDVKQTDKSYAYGVGADTYVIPKRLTLRLRYDYVDSDGHADFTYYTADALTDGRTNDNIDIANWDGYKKSAVTAKALYDFSKTLSVSAGFAYEHYKYSNAALDGYQYAFGTTSYLTGAYKDQSYNANTVFAGATYKF